MVASERDVTTRPLGSRLSHGEKAEGRRGVGESRPPHALRRGSGVRVRTRRGHVQSRSRKGLTERRLLLCVPPEWRHEPQYETEVALPDLAPFSTLAGF